MTINQQAADQLVADLIARRPELLGVEDCEVDDEGALQYVTESGHTIQVHEATPGRLVATVFDADEF